MNKTFYTVKYWIIGALSPTQCWFDSKEEAEQLVEADRLARKYHYK